jgi:hypothetical protein
MSPSVTTSLHIQTCSSIPTIAGNISGHPFWYGLENCHYIVQNFFFECKIMTFDLSHESWKEPEVAKRVIWIIQWLGNGYNLFLHQKLFRDGGVTRRIVIHLLH